MGAPENIIREKAQIRAAAYGAGGNGALTYLDTHDLKPRSVVNAGLSGAFSGLVVGGGISFMGMTMKSEIGENRNSGLSKNLNIFDKNNRGFAIFTLASTAIGAVTSIINANIHNKWAKQMTDEVLIPQMTQQQEPMTHAERAIASKEAAANQERTV